MRFLPGARGGSQLSPPFWGLARETRHGLCVTFLGIWFFFIVCKYLILLVELTMIELVTS